METVMLPTVATDTIALPVKDSPIPNPRLVDMRMSGASVVPSQTKTAYNSGPRNISEGVLNAVVHLTNENHCFRQP